MAIRSANCFVFRRFMPHLSVIQRLRGQNLLLGGIEKAFCVSFVYIEASESILHFDGLCDLWVSALGGKLFGLPVSAYWEDYPGALRAHIHGV